MWSAVSSRPNTAVINDFEQAIRIYIGRLPWIPWTELDAAEGKPVTILIIVEAF